MNALLWLICASATVFCATSAVKIYGGLLKRAPASLFVNAIAVSDRKCEQAVLESSQKTFNQELNIKSENDWSNSEVFVNEINAILGSGVDGLLKVCAARTRFYQNLGPTYDSCINTLYFLSHGFDSLQSGEYVKIFQQLDFMCNGGLLQAIRNWNCLMTESKDPLITQCIETFVNTSGSDFSTICPAAETLLMCVKMPFFSQCGAEAGWFECESFRSLLNINQNCMHLTCSYDMAPIPRAQTKSRHQLFRSRNPFFMPSEKQALFASLGAKAELRMKRRKREIEN